MRTFNAGDRYTVVFPRDGVAVIDGFVVLTEGALAGEKAVIELVSVNKSHGRARIVELLSRSCDRVMPDCERYGVCGGCPNMHQSYEGQLKAKENLVLQALERIGKMRDFSFQPISPSPRIFNYRNKTEFRFSGGKTGFFASSSHDLVPTDSCLIASDAANYAARLFSDAAEKYGFDSDGILTVRNSRGGDFGAVVETNAFFSRDRIDPLFAGETPRAILPLITRHVLNQENTLAAALRCDRKLGL
ncbi:MAG: hypothetical protein J5940_00900, partial [Clostridia bacterium]|nr:hypothetical protein [Clostridia bacterium]